MVCVPAPAVTGLKTPELTPGPEYVPPDGAPPDKVREPASIHIPENEPNVTDGNALTVMVEVAVEVQLLPSV